MFKCRKGFTLIELLAIIVILAVVAVVTVPIILGVIDDAKIGAAKVSAYGYKDSINKFYVTSLSIDDNFSMDDGVYTADEIKSLGISVSGEEPESNSWVVVSNNEVSSGCFQFGEYKVEMLNGDVSDTDIGSCGEYPVPSCPKCVFTNGVYRRYFKSTPNKTSDDFTVTGYKYDFKELPEIYSSSMTTQVFLGFMLDENDQIDRAFVCSFKNDIPFCIEGTSDGSKNASNGILLNSASLWNNNCTADENGNYICDNVASFSNGKVSIGVDDRVGQSNEFDIWGCTTRDTIGEGIRCELEEVH